MRSQMCPLRELASQIWTLNCNYNFINWCIYLNIENVIKEKTAVNLRETQSTLASLKHNVNLGMCTAKMLRVALRCSLSGQGYLLLPYSLLQSIFEFNVSFFRTR